MKKYLQIRTKSVKKTIKKYKLNLV